MSDEPQLLAVDLVRSNGLLALTGHHLVEMLPQPDLLAEEHIAASGRQVLRISGATDLESCDLLGVAHAPLVRAPIAVFQSTNSAPAVSPPTNAPEVAAISELSLAAAAATASPSPALLERLTPEQKVSFLWVWQRLPRHLREITFDLHSPEWTPAAIEELGDVLCEFPDVFSSSKTDFGSCSLMPFEISVPEGSAPVTSRPHRINPILAKKVDATLNQYLAAGLIQHSTSPYSSPLVVVPKTSGGVQITVNYKKLNDISRLSQLPIPRVDQVLGLFG